MVTFCVIVTFDLCGAAVPTVDFVSLATVVVLAALAGFVVFVLATDFVLAREALAAALARFVVFVFDLLDVDVFFAMVGSISDFADSATATPCGDGL